ncbi:MAG: exodeoxyribonuclease V subunit gamma [Bacteroidales bacterium]|nr:exodeoxyribonuclease V subunit gamma [Bacteroidales bacterium]
MSTFLSKLVDECVAHQWIHADTIIVLPNQRARKILVDEIQQRLKSDRPVFLPEILSIEHFIEKISPLRRAQPIELLSVLYDAYKPMSSRSDRLEDFMRWADTFIKDISELEVQMRPVEAILEDVAQSKDFEFRIGQDGLSQGQQATVSFYMLLTQLYKDFNERLLQQKIAYPGLLYRDCAEHIQDYAGRLTCKTIIFAGLYVLSISEQRMLQHLQSRFDTHFYFDFDPFYCDFEAKPLFSTSYFLDEVCTTLALDRHSLPFKETCYEDMPKTIQVVSAPGQLCQVQYAVHCLEQLQREDADALNHTVVVLADESLLLPFLKAYDTRHANVTMGVSFKVTPAYQLVYDLLDLYQYGSLQLAPNAEKPIPWYRPVLSNILRNRLVATLLPIDPQQREAVQAHWDSLLGKARVYVASGDEALTAMMPAFNGCCRDLLPRLIAYLSKIRDAMAAGAHDRLQVETALEALQEIEDFFQSTQEEEVPFAIQRTLILRSLEALSLPLEGDALQGLQVMGLLETRALDFDHVIMLGVNDGVLPRPVQYNSLLPFNYQYSDADMPNYIYKDKISAYHFFRLLQRARNVTLLYDNISRNSVSEPSRFISQLEFEVAQRGLSNITLSKQSVNFQLRSTPHQFAVHKNDEILAQLREFKFSTSSLQDYVRCPLQFYLKDLCRLRAEEDKDDVLRSNWLGTIVHAVLQDLFTAAMQSASPYAFLKQWDANTLDEQWIVPVIMRETGADKEDLDEGRYLLLKEMVCQHVKAYALRAAEEFEDGTVTILSLEQEVECTYPYTYGEEQGTVQLKGFIDRLQKKDNHLMILDYKTGSVDEDKLKIARDKIAKVFTDPQYDKLLQLFIYAELCYRTAAGPISSERARGVSNPICGIISTKECMTGKRSRGALFKMSCDGQDYFDELLLQEFEPAFNELIGEILDPDTDFTPKKNDRSCKYCDFKNLCRC